jgi:hypothetical protein
VGEAAPSFGENEKQLLTGPADNNDKMAENDSTANISSGVTAKPSIHVTLSTQLLEPLPEEQGFRNRLLSKLDHPETVFPLVLTGQSLGGALVDRYVPGDSVASRFVTNFLPKFAFALAGSFTLHETGHDFRTTNASRELGSSQQDVEAFRRGMNGISTTQWASQRRLQERYEGIGSDISYLVEKWDLPFYYFLQEPFIRINGGVTAGRIGDLSGYFGFRSRVHDNHEQEKISVSGLGVWQMMDAFRPLYRILKYLEEGKAPANPYSPGNWTLKTTGYLSSQGPLYGLRSYFFLKGDFHHPAFLSLVVWASPLSDQNRQYPFGVTLQAHRLPIAGLMVGPYKLAVGGLIGFSFQDPNPWEIHSAQRGRDRELIEAGASAFLHSESVEFQTTFSYREPQMIWRESFNTGSSGTVGVSYFF